VKASNASCRVPDCAIVVGATLTEGTAAGAGHSTSFRPLQQYSKGGAILLRDYEDTERAVAAPHSVRPNRRYPGFFDYKREVGSVGRDDGRGT